MLHFLLMVIAWGFGRWEAFGHELGDRRAAATSQTVLGFNGTLGFPGEGPSSHRLQRKQPVPADFREAATRQHTAAAAATPVKQLIALYDQVVRPAERLREARALTRSRAPTRSSLSVYFANVSSWWLIAQRC